MVRASYVVAKRDINKFPNPKEKMKMVELSLPNEAERRI